MNQTRVFIVDDHKIVRLGLKSYLLGRNEYNVSGEAENADELFKSLKKEIPEIVLLDIVMPGLSGVDACTILKKDFPQVKVLILTSNTDEEIIINCLEAGADGFLTKEATRDEFLMALDAINSGEKFFGKFALVIANSFLNNSKNSEKLKSILSPREVEIISLFCQGLSYKEIASKLFLSPRTVETHKLNIQKKLDIKTTVDMVKFAIKNNIIYL